MSNNNEEYKTGAEAITLLEKTNRPSRCRSRCGVSPDTSILISRDLRISKVTSFFSRNGALKMLGLIFKISSST